MKRTCVICEYVFENLLLLSRLKHSDYMAAPFALTFGNSVFCVFCVLLGMDKVPNSINP